MDRQRVLEAALAEQMELYSVECIAAMDALCAKGQHDPESEEYEGERILVCSWCSLPL